MGFDTIAAEAVLALKASFPHIKLILVLPCVSQTKGWNANSKERYERIKGQADKVVYTSLKYDRNCMFKRNQHLINHSSVCICYLEKRYGGMAYTVNYAKERGLRIINVAAGVESLPKVHAPRHGIF